ncbi:hypothetical protein MNBD_GAMMA01-1937 [hydrothermal vent metagenome]|uniref:TonB system biopolymer transport component Chromosome segregation ATPase n=1 Tax=hydrothermal vent metagenome TaxID=652676 RepID=A0A3B0VD57_9ZZZZ
MLNLSKSSKILKTITLSVILILTAGGVVNAQQLNTAIQVAVDTNKASAQAQTRIERLNDQTDDLTGQYRNILNEIESLRAYNKQLEAVVIDQREQVNSINLQMTTLEQTNRGVIPMIIEMVDALGKIVEADIPFKKERRQKRVAGLEEMLGKSDTTTAEKYRKVTEAYGIELDYGSSVDAYTGNLPSGKQVDFLRVGRTTLIYQTLNQEVSGWWNPSLNDFEILDKRYNSEIKEAIRIAKKQASPDLAGLPVFGAQAVGGQ